MSLFKEQWNTAPIFTAKEDGQPNWARDKIMTLWSDMTGDLTQMGHFICLDKLCSHNLDPKRTIKNRLIYYHVTPVFLSLTILNSLGLSDLFTLYFW